MLGWSLAPRGLYGRAYRGIKRGGGAVVGRQVPSKSSRRFPEFFCFEKTQVLLSANTCKLGAFITHFANNFTVDRRRCTCSTVLSILHPHEMHSKTFLEGSVSCKNFMLLKPKPQSHTYTEPARLCVCVFSSHSFWTSMDVPAGVTQEEGNTGFSIHLLSAVLALIFLAKRIQPFLSLVDREVEFCVLTI